MELARLDDFVEGTARRLASERAEILIQIVLELIAAAGLRAAHVVEAGDRGRIDHLGPEIAKLANRSAEQLFDLRIEHRRVVRLMQNAETRPFQSVAAQRVGVLRL